jgi:hypothetical protein
MKHLMSVIFLMAFCSTFAFAQSGEELAARQARSVHLQHRKYAKPAKVFYIETTIDHAAPGTYVCALGFDGGYCGLQELINGNHIAIFSIWEPNPSHNPNDVAEAKRTQLLYAGTGVHIQRFGGEGTGGKSMVPLQWELNRPVCMAISIEKSVQNRTAYTCWIWDDIQEGWFRMAAFSTLVNNGTTELSGPYSFVEDFLRNVKSKEMVRKARFSRLWTHDGQTWSAAPEAAFTADNNALMTIDAGPSENGYWLATGGSTTNVTTKLWQTIQPGPSSDASAARRLSLLSAIEEARASENGN